VLRLFQFGTDERRAFQSDLHRRVAARFEPVHEPRDLSGASRTVRALDDDEFARKILKHLTRGMPWP
jgi:hypothetical protein